MGKWCKKKRNVCRQILRQISEFWCIHVYLFVLDWQVVDCSAVLWPRQQRCEVANRKRPPHPQETLQPKVSFQTTCNILELGEGLCLFPWGPLEIVVLQFPIWPTNSWPHSLVGMGKQHVTQQNIGALPWFHHGSTGMLLPYDFRERGIPMRYRS